MKVFVYDKKTNETKAIIKNVIMVTVQGIANLIFIHTPDAVLTYNTQEVKTRIYQN